MKKTWKNIFLACCKSSYKEKPFLGAVGETIAASLALKIKKGKKLFVVCPNISECEKFSVSFNAISKSLGLPEFSLVFPEAPEPGRIVPSDETRRAEMLFKISRQQFRGTPVCTAKSFSTPLPGRDAIQKSAIELSVGMNIKMDELLRKLVSLDYDDECEVSSPGEFSRRGGILDIFSPSSEKPVRIEFWGDQIESMRFFNPETQLSESKTKDFTVIPKILPDTASCSSFLIDYLNPNSQIIIIYPEKCLSMLERFAFHNEKNNWLKILENLHSSKNCSFFLDEIESDQVEDIEPCGIFPPLDFSEDLEKVKENSDETAEIFQQIAAGRIRQWITEGIHCAITGKTEAALEYSREWCQKHRLPLENIEFDAAEIEHGFFIPSAKLAVIAEKELFFSSRPTRFAPAILNPEKTNVNFLDLQFAEICEGDYVVHNEYGIGIFKGIEEIEDKDRITEMFCIEFADDRLVHIPLYQADTFSRYVGAGKKPPKLNSIGGKRWLASKIAAAKAVKGLAAQMLKLQAERIHSKGFQFQKDDSAQYIFEQSFPYEDTPDQRRATEEVKADMESEKPMDRLVCGDVGYGKTEIAARAAFKAVSAGKQVAILVPTTLLAQQHFYTFCERFQETPIIIEMLSRFKNHAEQKEIIERLSKGAIDIIIGTHRLVQGDVVFKDLGLLIIDEEQRFGVEVKEKLKALKKNVDILTLTATPIPRTLYMSITGIRSLSAIMTPPELRLPIKTVVTPFSEKIIVDAINAELERGGQVYYLHNRIATIERTCSLLQKLVPNAKFAIAHGGMQEHELEKTMTEFLAGKCDVLVCTTIIQSGIDIPNANTIIIERADRFGLAELYQIRGRVGRWTRQAYAYLLIPEHSLLEGNARQRIAAIKKFSQLGAGFRIALRDLEIRGAGNILGHEQSGHINAVGFDLYCALLRNAVAELSGKKEEVLVQTETSFDFIEFAHVAKTGRIAAGIPPEYIPFENLRVEFYRRFAKLADDSSFNKMKEELEDRFGKIPEETETLLRFFKIRFNLSKNHCIFAGTKDDKLLIKMLPARGQRNEFEFQLKTKNPKEKLHLLEKISENPREKFEHLIPKNLLHL